MSILAKIRRPVVLFIALVIVFALQRSAAAQMGSAVVQWGATINGLAIGQPPLA